MKSKIQKQKEALVRLETRREFWRGIMELPVSLITDDLSINDMKRQDEIFRADRDKSVAKFAARKMSALKINIDNLKRKLEV